MQFTGLVTGFSAFLVSLSVLCPVAGPVVAAPPAALRLEKIELADHRGKVWSLAEIREAGEREKSAEGQESLVVVAFLGTECPLAKTYSVRLSELADDYAGRGVSFVGVISNRQDSLQKIAAFVDRQKIGYPVLKDPGNRFADRLGAERTPEVFLFDAKGDMRYWGRIDDRFGIGYSRDRATREDLKEAIDELLAGREVSVKSTRSVGCIIGRSKPTDPDAEITYANTVAAILGRRCMECHRDDDIAPFSMENPEEVAGWADMIVEVVREGRMPPWHASPEHGEFSNDRAMPEAEKQTLYAWADAGAPVGDLERDGHLIPPAPELVSGWQLHREPDLVVDVSPKPFAVPATGTVKYQYFVVDPGLEDDVWLEAAEFLPGDRAVVHHILGFTRPRGSRGGLEGSRGFLVGYVPGARNEPWPEGMAKRIPGGSELVFQVHYTPVGTPREDRSRLGLWFADPAKITHEVVTTSAIETKFAIPPGADHHMVHGASPTIKTDGLLLGMSPHMHVRGKAFRYELQKADGRRTTLLDIPGYDFNWQTTYVLREPLSLEPGDRMFCTAVYDNSESNLNNPDPSKTVRWGDQTWDEMMIGYFHYAVARSHSPAGERDERPAVREAAVSGRTAALLRRFDALDRGGEGKLLRSKVPPAVLPIFDALDADGDGVLTREEVLAADL